MSKLREKIAENENTLQTIQDIDLGNAIKQSILTNVTEEDILEYCDNYRFTPQRLNDPTAFWYLDVFKSKGLNQNVFNELKQNFNLQEELSNEATMYILTKANKLDTLVDVSDVYNYFQPILEKLDAEFPETKKQMYASSRLKKLIVQSKKIEKNWVR